MKRSGSPLDGKIKEYRFKVSLMIHHQNFCNAYNLGVFTNKDKQIK
jgi:hypothetical protein